ncbi:MAG: CPXCG motif-containing cysteine-rich protein [Myxococcota bacterium]
MLLETGYVCASCGEYIDTTVDPSAGSEQVYVEDCAVCCRPNTLRVRVSPEEGTAWIEASFEE